MSRSLKISRNYLEKVKLAVKRNGFPNQKSLALDTGLALATVSKFLTGKAVDYTNFVELCQKLAFDWREVAEVDSNVSPAEPVQMMTNTRRDWGEARDVSIFFGREEELATLGKWIVGAGCRLVTILGMGGIGKSALSVKLAQFVQEQFEYVIWRSLKNAPPIKDILIELIQFFSNEQETNLPETVDGGILRLMEYLRKHRCLLVLDNVESILQPGSRTGAYREDYKGYEQLFQCIGETPHTSCLVLTSREKPKGLAAIEGETLPIRCLQLVGLPQAESCKIFQLKGCFTGSESEWELVISHYAGNPLALKIVAAAILDFFEGSLGKCVEILTTGTLVFDDIRDLLERQFNRLSDLEQEVMYWLAINREPVSFQELQEDIVGNKSQCELLQAVVSLARRSLIEKTDNGFTQQPVVIEYMTERFIEQVWEEIASEKMRLLMSHALMKATAKDYIRETQVRVILEPLAEKLRTNFRNNREVENKLKQILLKLREKFSAAPGYGGGNIINLLNILQINLENYDLSNLTIWQAGLRQVNLHHVNCQNADLAKSVFTETLGIVLSVAFSPCGKFVTTSDVDGEIRLWQVATGRQLLTCKAQTNWVWSVNFSPDGKVLVSGSGDEIIRLWDTRTGQCITTLKGHTSQVWSVAFTPDGKTLASGSEDMSVKLWDIATGRCIRTLQGHTNSIHSVTFTPDGKILASGSLDCSVRLWNTDTGECHKILQGHTNRVWSIAFSPDGKTLASGGDTSVKLWDTYTGDCVSTLKGHTNQVWSVAFSLDGHILASGSSDQTVRLWDSRTGQCRKVLQGHTNQLWSVAFSPDGTTLASGSEDNTVRLWDIRDGKCLKTLQGQIDKVWSVAFSPDGKTLASGSNNQMVRLWDISTGRCVSTFKGHTNQVWSVAFNPQGNILASGGEDGTVRLWNVLTGQCIRTLQEHANWIWSVAFSPQGHILASGGEDQKVRLWNVATGECFQTLQGHTDWIWSVAFSPQGHILASGGGDEKLLLWDVCTGSCLKTLQAHISHIHTVTFSPDGRILASSSSDQTVKLWDVHSGKCVRTLQGHTNWVRSLAFSPDGQILVSGSPDQTVKLWDVTTGECLKTMQGHTSQVWSVAFSPHGSTFASSSTDETVKLWDVNTGECLKTLRPKRLYEGMNITGATGLSIAQKATLKALGAVELEQILLLS
ncbi:NB-ARC domain-containing protein [Brasilonema sp. UFV-L1]|uniref:WD40 domain-containing protein n=1 Tax=Brasilonema sp. UFV-L1 TaxID=2234130 RepID=UPI00145CB6BF|nr:NB-ARC domain-containing protein [Brasilonema sp. UFV-L1]NMG08753.1 hypothetical protein [Brasilonema sp. UFV-L1]